MKINTFEFEDKSRGWKLSQTRFERLTLLVGASGVGKTQILLAIQSLKKIAEGTSLNGIAWKVNFSTTLGNDFVWEGEFEERETSIFDLNSKEPIEKDAKIVFEKILKNGELQVDRNEGKIVFKGNETIKLTREKSLLHHLEEDFIQEMKPEIKKIELSDHSTTLPINSIDLTLAGIMLFMYDTLEEIKQSDLQIQMKLFLISQTEKRVFEKIKDRFIDIFPQVEDLKIAPVEFKNDNFSASFKEHLFIQIKEKGVKKWVVQDRISSGMLRSLFHISELYLSPEGTVFLIDEFENSLGINCIDELTADILQSRRSLQFILTSHHPYIINAISFKHWKLVTRNKGVVKTHNASELNLGKSKHDAFMQLLQLEEYQTGNTPLDTSSVGTACHCQS